MGYRLSSYFYSFLFGDKRKQLKKFSRRSFSLTGHFSKNTEALNISIPFSRNDQARLRLDGSWTMKEFIVGGWWVLA